jgi:hypothetical protein
MPQPTSLVLYGHPTPSDLRFMNSDPFSFPPTNYSALSHSSTRSDAQSAPPGFDALFDTLCTEYSRVVHETGRVLPPEWTMPDLVRAAVGNEAINTPGFLTELYYDLMICGTRSWGYEELQGFLDLINYAPSA